MAVSEAAPDTRFAWAHADSGWSAGSWAASTSARMQSGLMGNRLAVKRLKSHGNRAGAVVSALRGTGHFNFGQMPLNSIKSEV